MNFSVTRGISNYGALSIKDSGGFISNTNFLLIGILSRAFTNEFAPNNVQQDIT